MRQLYLLLDRTSRGRYRRGTARFLIGFLGLVGCSPDQLIGNAPLPTDVIDPAATRTPGGAVAAYNSSLVAFRSALNDYVPVSGVLVDELYDGVGLGSPYSGISTNLSDLDRRVLPELEQGEEVVSVFSYVGTYLKLHQVRNQAREAIGLLATYAPALSPALRGHLYAAQGYAEVMLAELFCSGVPLSTVDFEGDYTLTRGFSTAEVQEHAVALFDTALALSADSARILHFARVGRGRALLALGEVARAADAVSAVPQGYRYQVQFTTTSGANALNFARVQTTSYWNLSVADREGGNGLDYRTSGDPRSIATSTPRLNSYGATLYHPTKYARTGASPIVVADWIEARLIEAEAALALGSGSWLTILNALRTNGAFTTRPNAADPAKTDTLWNAGSAGITGLAPLEDPGAPNTRVDLLFRERAFWLFLTGHRQGDLRRLIRQYNRAPEQVYPIGPYPGGSSYGADVAAPIPANERAYNPNVTGCLSRGA